MEGFLFSRKITVEELCQTRFYKKQLGLKRKNNQVDMFQVMLKNDTSLLERLLDSHVLDFDRLVRLVGLDGKSPLYNFACIEPRGLARLIKKYNWDGRSLGLLKHLGQPPLIEAVALNDKEEFCRWVVELKWYTEEECREIVYSSESECGVSLSNKFSGKWGVSMRQEIDRYRRKYTEEEIVIKDKVQRYRVSEDQESEIKELTSSSLEELEIYLVSRNVPICMWANLEMEDGDSVLDKIVEQDRYMLPRLLRDGNFTLNDLCNFSIKSSEVTSQTALFYLIPMIPEIVYVALDKGEDDLILLSFKRPKTAHWSSSALHLIASVDPATFTILAIESEIHPIILSNIEAFNINESEVVPIAKVLCSVSNVQILSWVDDHQCISLQDCMAKRGCDMGGLEKEV